jgi:hypothetical protein
MALIKSAIFLQNLKLAKTFVNQEKDIFQCIPAHTFILTEVSPPFEAMFSGNWIEANGGGVYHIAIILWDRP